MLIRHNTDPNLPKTFPRGHLFFPKCDLPQNKTFTNTDDRNRYATAETIASQPPAPRFVKPENLLTHL